MSLKLITAPAIQPITLDEAKSHLRVDFTDDDDLIQGMIEGATDYAESFLGRALIDQTWQLTLDSFPGHHRRGCSGGAEIKIPRPPLIEVTAVNYDDASGNQQTLDAARYTTDADSEPGWVLPIGSWPATFAGINAVRIQFRCGYLDQTSSPPVQNVPSSIKAAIKLIVGDLYAHRETIIVGDRIAVIPLSAEMLLRRKRFDLSMA